MSDARCEENLARYRVGQRWDSPQKFCLAQIFSYEPDAEEARQKIDDLLGSIQEGQGQKRTQWACTIGGCTLKITKSAEGGKQVSGACKAAEYCLKEQFEAVGSAKTVAEGRELYGEIIDSLEGHANKNNAGNFCPRFDCSLSAGVSIDMVPGTVGECIVEIRSAQQQLAL